MISAATVPHKKARLTQRDEIMLPAFELAADLAVFLLLNPK
jgi:hypothetical protein